MNVVDTTFLTVPPLYLILVTFVFLLKTKKMQVYARSNENCFGVVELSKSCVDDVHEAGRIKVDPLCSGSQVKDWRGVQ